MRKTDLEEGVQSWTQEILGMGVFAYLVLAQILQRMQWPYKIAQYGHLLVFHQFTASPLYATSQEMFACS